MVLFDPIVESWHIVKQTSADGWSTWVGFTRTILRVQSSNLTNTKMLFWDKNYFDAIFEIFPSFIEDIFLNAIRQGFRFLILLSSGGLSSYIDWWKSNNWLIFVSFDLINFSMISRYLQPCCIIFTLVCILFCSSPSVGIGLFRLLAEKFNSWYCLQSGGVPVQLLGLKL